MHICQWSEDAPPEWKFTPAEHISVQYTWQQWTIVILLRSVSVSQDLFYSLIEYNCQNPNQTLWGQQIERALNEAPNNCLPN